MRVAAYEGIVEKGRVRLITKNLLPEGARVYVVVPDVAPLENVLAEKPIARIYSPRLVHPEQARDFEMQVISGESNAPV